MIPQASQVPNPVFSRQVISPELSGGSSSPAKTCAELRSGPNVSSGESAPDLSVFAAGSSSAEDLEKNSSLLPQCSEPQEKKVSGRPCCALFPSPWAQALPREQEAGRARPEGPGLPLMALSPQSWESTSLSSLDTAGTSSAPSCTSCPSPSSQMWA